MLRVNVSYSFSTQGIVIPLFLFQFRFLFIANTKRVEFNLPLSNNEVLKVSLSFELISQPIVTTARTTTTNTIEMIELSTISPTTTAAATAYDDDDNDDDDDGDNNNNEDDYKGGEGNDGFTADWAIKLFQTYLIEKEKNIGGILNASAPFYRHFNLQYKSSAISVRCLYNSNYEKKTLNIKCT